VPTFLEVDKKAGDPTYRLLQKKGKPWGSSVNVPSHRGNKTIENISR
jgi:hypothetical protein